MKITTDEVKYVANLARLKVDETEAEALASDMESIIGFMDQLNTLDTADIEPTNHAVPVSNVFREDVVTGSFDRDKLLANAPQKENGCYLVPRVVE